MLKVNNFIKFEGMDVIFIVKRVNNGFAVLNEKTSENLLSHVIFSNLEDISRILRFEIIK